MSKYFITVTYRNYLAPASGEGAHWSSWGLQTCNGLISVHPVTWLGKQYNLQRKAWDDQKDHTSFKEILFYDLLPDDINTDDLQDLS